MEWRMEVPGPGPWAQPVPVVTGLPAWLWQPQPVTWPGPLWGPVPMSWPGPMGAPMPTARPGPTGNPTRAAGTGPTGNPTRAVGTGSPANPEPATSQHAPAQQALYQRLIDTIDQGNPPLFQMASLWREMHINPRMSGLPGMEMFSRAMKEMLYGRYALRGAAQRSLMGEQPSAVNESLALGAMITGRMAEEANWLLLNRIRMGATQETRPQVEQIGRGLEAERANFRAVMNIIDAILGPDAAAVRQRVMQAVLAAPVQEAGQT